MSVELVGARCIVRPFVVADAASVASVANDRRIWLQLRDLFPHPYHLADAEAWISRVTSFDPPQALAIVVDERAVGGVGLELMTDVNRRSAEIGYWLGTAYWGRGIATDAVAVVTNWAFGALGLLRIFAQPFAANVASRRVLEKAGYALEGIMRRSAVKDGAVLDQCMYARLSSSTWSCGSPTASPRASLPDGADSSVRSRGSRLSAQGIKPPLSTRFQGAPKSAADELQAAIERAEGKRRELFEARPTGREDARVLALMPRAAELYREQIEQGLGGDPAAAAKARTILRDMLGESMLEPAEDGSLWAEYAMQPATLLSAGTGGRGEAICSVPAISVWVRVR
jgi:RimJ/RimL family protein N-acetyltransferase